MGSNPTVRSKMNDEYTNWPGLKDRIDRIEGAAKQQRCLAIAYEAVEKGLTSSEDLEGRVQELAGLEDQTLNGVERIISDYPMPPKISESTVKAMETLSDEA